MKSIGILGGIGPQATMELQRKLHAAAQRLIPQHQNSGYPPMLVYFVRDVPFVLEHGHTPRVPYEPNPKLLDGARVLGTACDFVLIASNATHMLREHVERASSRPVLSMIDAVLRDVRRRAWNKVGVLGLGSPLVYTRPLDELGVAHETIDGPLRDTLDEGIFASMEGRSDARWTDAALEAVALLRRRGAHGIILGCTEIPIVLGAEVTRRLIDEGNVIDPLDLLADAAVRHAIA
jgi:aspartate racemase